MIALLWTYRVGPQWTAEFEAVYGPDGDWAQLFRQAPGYLGTELLRQGEGRYATIDRWDNGTDFRLFKANCAEAYAMLDERCEMLTEEEQFVGEFEVYEPASG